MLKFGGHAKMKFSEEKWGDKVLGPKLVFQITIHVIYVENEGMVGSMPPLLHGQFHGRDAYIIGAAQWCSG